MPLVSQIEAGNVGYVRAPWNAALIAELRDFPHGSHDDQVDALVRAYNALDDEPEPTRSDFNHHFIR